jgi:DNA-binding GntR family transcriptional regulator
VSDDVYDVLLELLMDQRIAPGERVSIDGWARQLEVSQTPVREALTRLSGEGLLVKRNMKGYVAAPVLDDAGLDELYELRGMVEPAVARLAAERAGREQIDGLGECVCRMREVILSVTDRAMGFRSYREFSDLDARFHAALAESAGNRLVVETLSRLRSHRHIFRVMAGRDAMAEASEEHGEIFEAVRNRQPETAETVMRRHLERSRARIRQPRNESPHREFLPQ